MKFIIYNCFLCLTFFACQRKTASQVTVTVPATPICIQQKIDSIKQRPVSNPPAEINEYVYHRGEVYVISARCCDFYSTAVDSNCNYVCAPSGGITGKGDRKCADFLESAKSVRLVWKDERKKQQ